MAAPKMYKTKQRQLILQVLQEPSIHHATADYVLETLKAGGQEVGLATIYRNLDKLVNEGLVLKYTLPNGMRACYQYLAECGEHAHHCHVLCSSCGKVSHLECSQVDTLAAHLLAEHSLTLDRQKTVLYGLCAACTAKKNTRPRG